MRDRCGRCFYKKIAREEDKWCYMFSGFMKNCRQFIGDSAVARDHIIAVLPTALEMIIAKRAKR